MEIGYIALIVLAVVIVWVIIAYNKIVTLKNQYANGFAQIDVQLRRRYDLIPNLVDTAKKYMQHEKETFQQVIEARNQAQAIESQAASTPGSNENMKALVGAENALNQSMGKLFALVENYPDLKANQTMQQLMEELASTENKVGFARQAYNDSVMAYNTGIEVFPNNIVAGFFRFNTAIYFEIEEEAAKKPVKVSFD
jgi:LemA protein